MGKIPFIITIDTEGDNLWSKPEFIETKNTEGLYRFQEICNTYGFKPVYLTNYEMAMDDKFVEFGKKYSSEGQCEIGMHLHAWNSPPDFNLTGDDMRYQPFLCEYPVEMIDKKVKFMTELLRSRFSSDIVSHRSGRWAMSKDYFSILKKYGYLVDCSVTPGIDWSRTQGDPAGKGGTNYHYYPHRSYNEPEGILEVPVTIEAFPRYEIFRILDGVKYKLPQLLYRLCFRNIWLRPSGNNLSDMKDLIKKSVHSECEYLEFMIHSSELSEGLNPNFVTKKDIDLLYENLGELFQFVAAYAEGYTLREFYEFRRHYDSKR